MGSFHLPETVPGTELIGNAQNKTSTVENSLGGARPGFPAGDGPLAAVNPAMEVELGNTQSAVPTVLNSQGLIAKAASPK